MAIESGWEKRSNESDNEYRNRRDDECRERIDSVTKGTVLEQYQISARLLTPDEPQTEMERGENSDDVGNPPKSDFHLPDVSPVLGPILGATGLVGTMAGQDVQRPQMGV